MAPETRTPPRRPPAVDDYDVNPSDISQSLFRVVLVTIVLIWTYLSADGGPGEIPTHAPHFQFAIIYLALSVAILAWNHFIVRRIAADSWLIAGTRICTIFTDITAVSVYADIRNAAIAIARNVYSALNR